MPTNEIVTLAWTSPAAENLQPQNFRCTRGEQVSVLFARASSSGRVITGATITVRFATSEIAHTTLKVTATVSGTGFTAILTDTNTTALSARKWYFQAFDETDKELLSWGWMDLKENTDLSESGGDLPFNDTYVPLTRVLTINGVSYDLSADRSWDTIAGSTIDGGNAATGG